MATISFSDAAPEVEGPVRFTFAADTFDLKSGGSVEVTDPATIASAKAHPWLSVEEATESDLPSAEETAKQIAESDDPHVNPTVDHLSDRASDEALANAQKVREEAAEAATPQPIQAEPEAEPTVTKPAPQPSPALSVARTSTTEGARS